MKEKICGHCGQAFGCAGTYGCWCGDLKLTDVQRAWIKERYQNCLCPACLAAVAAGTLVATE